MSTYGWKAVERITVPKAATVNWELPLGRPVLEKLTILAASGSRSVAGLSFQAKLNGVNFGSAVAHVGPGILATVVFQCAQGAATENFVLPSIPTDPSDSYDPLTFVVAVTSTAAASQEVTLIAAAVGRSG